MQNGQFQEIIKKYSQVSQAIKPYTKIKLKTSICIFFSILYRVTNDFLRKDHPKKNDSKTAKLTGARLKNVPLHYMAKVERLQDLISSKHLKGESPNSGDRVAPICLTRLPMQGPANDFRKKSLRVYKKLMSSAD